MFVVKSIPTANAKYFSTTRARKSDQSQDCSRHAAANRLLNFTDKWSDRVMNFFRETLLVFPSQSVLFEKNVFRLLHWLNSVLIWEENTANI